MAIDKHIEELVKLYERSLSGKRVGKGITPEAAQEMTLIGTGMENAIMVACDSEAAMMKSVAMERMAVARAKALGVM